MENNTLTNQLKVKALFDWTNKKYLSVSIAYWILLFMVYPLIEIFLMIISNNKNGFKVSYQSRMESYGVNFTMVLFVGVAIGYSIIMCLIAFSYMHNKRCMDMFGSLPLSKRSVFFSRLISVVVTTIVPVVIIGALGAVLTLSKTMAIMQIKNLIILIVALHGNIGVMAVISLCCGTAIDTIICYAIINVAYPVAVAICVYYPHNIIPGMTQDGISSNIYTLLCPVASAYTGIYGDGKILYIIWWTAVIATSIFVCNYLCRKRKAETAQSNFAFGVVEIGIKFLAGFVLGLTMGIIFGALGYSNSGIGSSYIWLAVGVFIGVFVAEFLLHLIFHRGLNRLKDSLKQGLIAVCAVGMFCLIIFTGALGYDTKIPDEKDVEGVIIKYRYDESFIVRGKDIINTYQNDKNTINETIKVHQSIIDKVKKNKCKGILYYMNRNEYDAYTKSSDTIIKYKLKNGKEITRMYYGGEIPSEQVESIEKLVHDDVDILEKIPQKYVASINIWSDTKEMDYTTNNQEKCQKLIDAIIKDKNKSDKITETSDYYSLNIFYTDTGNNKNFKHSYYRSLIVYKDYKETIKVLEEIGALD